MRSDTTRRIAEAIGETQTNMMADFEEKNDEDTLVVLSSRIVADV